MQARGSCDVPADPASRPCAASGRAPPMGFVVKLIGLLIVVGVLIAVFGGR
jgi:hypothetical protein